MQPSVEIRPATLADAAEIARLAGELGYPTTTDAMTRGLTALLANTRHYVAVAASDGRLLGWMHVENRVSLGGDRAELRGLVVDPAARRRGVGRRLVAVAEQWARSRELASLIVRSNVVRDQSHPFYESLGYSRRKTQHVYGKKLAPDASR